METWIETSKGKLQVSTIRTYEWKDGRTDKVLWVSFSGGAGEVFTILGEAQNISDFLDAQSCEDLRYKLKLLVSEQLEI